MIRDMTGVRIGKLVALTRIPGHKKEGKKTKWSCACDCGRVVEVFQCNLIREHTTSCGCSWKHGHHRSPTYVRWESMIQRCYDENFESYQRYGGRGITICDRWRHSFPNFLADMGEAPTGLWLDRIDNNKGYEPENCRWATPKQQGRNRSSNVLLTHNGVTLCASEWSERLGLSRTGVSQRIYHGWSVARAVTTPSKKGNVLCHR